MDNKTKILDSALELFHARGYDSVGVQEIAEMAGVTKPTLYYYFGNKQGLLSTLLNLKYEEMKTAVFGNLDECKDLRQRLTRVAGAYLDYAGTNRKSYLLIMAMFYSAKENEAYQSVKPIVRDFYQRMVGLFEDAWEQLGNMRGRQEQFALGFTGLLDHYILLESQKSEIQKIPEEVKEGLIQQFLYGIYT